MYHHHHLTNHLLSSRNCIGPASSFVVSLHCPHFRRDFQFKSDPASRPQCIDFWRKQLSTHAHPSPSLLHRAADWCDFSIPPFLPLAHGRRELLRVPFCFALLLLLPPPMAQTLYKSSLHGVSFTRSWITRGALIDSTHTHTHGHDKAVALVQSSGYGFLFSSLHFFVSLLFLIDRSVHPLRSSLVAFPSHVSCHYISLDRQSYGETRKGPLSEAEGIECAA